MIIPAAIVMALALAVMQLQSVVVLLRDHDPIPLALCVLVSPLSVAAAYSAVASPIVGLVLGTAAAITSLLYALSFDKAGRPSD